jgi:hypothetical protein
VGGKMFTLIIFKVNGRGDAAVNLNEPERAQECTYLIRCYKNRMAQGKHWNTVAINKSSG